ncbi:hypothetical protein ABK040_008532 [Willaertia magna]
MYKKVWLKKEEVIIGKNQPPHLFADNKIEIFLVTKEEEINQKKSKIKFNLSRQDFNFLLSNDEDCFDQLLRFRDFFKKISSSQNDNYFIIFGARGKWFTMETLQKETFGILVRKFVCIMKGLFNYDLYQYANNDDQSVAFIYDNNEKKCFEPKKNDYMQLKYNKVPNKTICSTRKAKEYENMGWLKKEEQMLKELESSLKKACYFTNYGNNAIVLNDNKRIKKINDGWNCGALGVNCYHYKIKIITLPSKSGLAIGFAQKSKFYFNGLNHGSNFGWYLCDGSITNLNYTPGTIIEVKYNSQKETISFVINEQNYEKVFTNVKDTGDICPAFDIFYQNTELEFIDL